MITLEIKWHLQRPRGRASGNPGRHEPSDQWRWRARIQLVDISTRRKEILKFNYIFSEDFPSLSEFSIGKLGEIIKSLSLKILGK